MIRINKWLSEMGVCSKKQADRLIADGQVLVNGKPAELGMKLNGKEQVVINGKAIVQRPKSLFLLYNKPVGVVCTHDKTVKNSIDNHLDFPQRVFAVGRLDKDSEGLLLLTNQGDVVNKIMRAENKHVKTYKVWVDKSITSEFIHQMSQGVAILNTTTMSCKVQKVNKNCFQIELIQGLNRQIRRMCKTLGYKVERLKRTHIMKLDLANLKVGDYRELNAEEEKELLISLNLSENRPNT